jgi:CRP/FNR family transcriptional regulator, cyclic AMP receptor protein
MASRTAIAFDPLALFRKVDKQTTVKNHRSHEPIFLQGEKADAMFFVQTGNVKLTVESKQGKKAVIAILRRGDYFGEGCLVKNSLRVASATAIQTATIARVNRGAIVRAIHQEPALAKLFISFLVTRIGRVEQDFVEQIVSSSEKRLARILLMLAGFGLQANPGPVLLKVSQEALAEMVGTTRSRVSYFMNRFRDMGLIDYNGGLQVHSELRTVLLKK